MEPRRGRDLVSVPQGLQRLVGALRAHHGRKRRRNLRKRNDRRRKNDVHDQHVQRGTRRKIQGRRRQPAGVDARRSGVLLHELRTRTRPRGVRPRRRLARRKDKPRNQPTISVGRFEQLRIDRGARQLPARRARRSNSRSSTRRISRGTSSSRPTAIVNRSHTPSPRSSRRLPRSLFRSTIRTNSS